MGVQISAGVLACACIAFAVIFAVNGLATYAVAAVLEAGCTIGLALLSRPRS